MKKLFTILFATMLATQAWAQTTFEIDGLKYTVTDEANCYVSVGKGNTLSTGALAIPSTVKNGNTTYTITSIGYVAFFDCSGLTSITIPNSVTSIGTRAFGNCSNLTSITIPNSVTRIDDYAFGGCSNLASVTIPNSVTLINEGAFNGCSGLTSITIPNSVTRIDDYAFGGCSNLASVTIPNSVTDIGKYTFQNCSGLTSVTIPNSVTSIGKYTFQNCSGLTSVTIPNSVTFIGDGAFNGCSSLTSITLPFTGDKPHKSTDTYQYPLGYIFGTDSYEGGTAITQYYYGSSVSSTTSSKYYIPSSLESVTITGSSHIPYGAFEYCYGLTSVTIPNSVTSIGDYAFGGCSNLSSVTIPNSVTSIGKYTFQNCSGLTSVTIPNSVTSIGSGAFRNCTRLTEIIVESANTNYTCGNGVLFNKNKTKLICFPAGKTGTYTIPNSVTSIDNIAFYDCSALISITVPNSIKSIGNNAFTGCNSLTSVTTDCEIIGSAYLYFTKDNIRYQVLNKNDVEIVSNNNSDNYSGDVIIPSTVSAGNTFSVKSIKSKAFNNCKNITSLTIPNSVTSIGEGAFSGCDCLTSVTTDCAIIGSANLHFTKDSIRYRVLNKSDVEIVSNNNSNLYSGEVIIPAFVIAGNTFSVKSIGSRAFYNCKNIISLTIPDSVTSIGNNAFSGCSGLTSVIIPNSVTSIGNNTFFGCDSLTSITTGCAIVGSANLHFTKDNIRYRVLNKNDIEVVSNNKSDSYSGEIIIPATVVAGNSFWVKSINSDAFNNCKNLTSLTIPNSVSSIDDYTFRNCSGVTSVIIGNYVNRIGEGAFSGCSSLTSVCIPDSVTSIGSSAFSGCSGLTMVTIPKSVTSIGGNAFENCSGLTSIVIPNSVTSIGAYAFKDCVNLTIYCQAKVKHTGWNDKWNINECPVVWGAQLVNVNVAANNSVYGQVSGMGAYTDGSQATILAIANVGYVFVKWSDDNTENPRTVVASGDLNFTAIFEKTNEPEEGNEQEGENQGGNNEGNENQGNENNPGTAVAESAANAINIYAHYNTIVVENVADEICIYDAMGRMIARRDAARHVSTTEIRVNGTGLYIVKVGNVAKRVMVNE